MTEPAPTRPGRPLLLRIGLSRLPAGFLVLPLLASLQPGRRVEAATPSRFTAVNGSPYVIRAVYACSPRSPSWGVNLIEGKTLPPGRQIAVELKQGCGTYDLRFVADDGIEFLEDGVPFCGATAEEAGAQSAAPGDRDDVVTLGKDSLAKALRSRSDASPAMESR
jgi:hypothetical protein